MSSPTSDDTTAAAGARAVPASSLSRRGLLGGAAAGAASLAVLASAGPASAAPILSASKNPGAKDPRPASALSSQQKAFLFLDGRMDEYGSGTELRLPRSYAGGFFTTPTFDFVSSFAYDDALVILAYLGRGLRRDVMRAALLGDALLYLQANDPLADGRTRASYQPDNFPVASPPRPLDIGSPAAFTGNQAWVGMAFAHLYKATRSRRFLAGALRLGQWIRKNTLDSTRAPFGFTGGRDADDNPLTFKATEHNIDVAAFFTQLAQLTGDRSWSRDARVAVSFIAAMQDGTDSHLWTGTNPDGVTTNYYPIPEDVQSWAYLATRDRRYAPSLTWVTDNLTATDGPYTGPSFSNTDTSKVWFEGTGQLALALRTRNAHGDAARVTQLLTTLRTAQQQQPNGDGRGIVAASSDGLDTGFGDLYYASLHTGATAWYLLALTGSNPFRLGRWNGLAR